MYKREIKIYKIPSEALRAAKWDYQLPLIDAMQRYPEFVISISSSQLTRFIEELTNAGDLDSQVKAVRRRIRNERKKPAGQASRSVLRRLYSELYELEFQPNIIDIVMATKSDYLRANLGFKVNGIEYKRFVGTNGGVKNRTIRYVSAELHTELVRRKDNGRNMEVELVPAKLGSYEALICSSSTPIPFPRGVLVVPDCITHFEESVLMLNDENTDEPVMTEESCAVIDHNDSDGYGMMLPAYSKRINASLGGDPEQTIPGATLRAPFTKGMIYTYDFVEFADTVANKSQVMDVWGNWHDIHDIELVLTESCLKLWHCYDSIEDFLNKSALNHYTFAVTKVTPQKLESVRYMNYQFLQSYDLTDEEIDSLCQRTYQEIDGVLGLDYRKTLTSLTGYSMNDEMVVNGADISVLPNKMLECMMVEPQLIYDPYVRKCIQNMNRKHIEMAAKGSVLIDANFAVISGDPYALSQSMFGMEVTGLLGKGEIYHKYWIDKGASEVTCFRAPMTCHNNIRKLKLAHTMDMEHWYQYMSTVAILNAWDTTCEAMNGADKDGDTIMVTDNQIILNKTKNSPTIICVQRKANKKIVTEQDIVDSNILAFNDDIGKTTNRVTSMFEVQAGYEAGSEEHRMLDYRIRCGQLYQQNAIDRTKGIIAKPMPQHWYSQSAYPPAGDDESTKIQLRIVANKKPYFMIYVYPALRREVNNYIKNNDCDVIKRFREYGLNSVEDLKEHPNKTQAMNVFLDSFKKYFPVGQNDCTVNRICKSVENHFRNTKSKVKNQAYFDLNLLKSGTEYDQKTYKALEKIWKSFRERMKNYVVNDLYSEHDGIESTSLMDEFRYECALACPNKDMMKDILIDLCYKTEYSKLFLWNMCGEDFFSTLLLHHDNMISYPMQVNENGEFEYAGRQFIMRSIEYPVESEDEL